MKSAVFLQVRLDSRRFPGKALKILGDKTLTEHAMDSLSRIGADDFVLLTARGDEEALLPLCRRRGFKLFAGDREDVLNRFAAAAREFKPDIIIRATGDNALVSWENAQVVLDYLQAHSECDYAAMKGLPLGCGVEVFRTAALFKALESTDPYDHEHVTPWIYRHPEDFTLSYLEHKPFMTENYRVTLDTEEDYLYLKDIFKVLYKGQSISFNELKEYLLYHD